MVLLLTDHFILFSLAQHNNTFQLILPDHLPEIIDSVWEWPLSGNVRSFLSIPLNSANEHVVKGHHCY